MLNKHIWIASLLLASAGAAMAQAMVEAKMLGQPLSYSKNGNTEGCGVRIVGIVPSVPGSKSFKTFDVSVNFWKSGIAMGKMIGSENQIGNPVSGSRRLVLRSGWLKAEGKNPAAPIGSGFQSSKEDKGAYLFPVDIEGAIDFILAASAGERVQVALAWDEKAEWIYSGTVDLSERESIQIAQCFKEVLK